MILEFRVALLSRLFGFGFWVQGCPLKWTVRISNRIGSDASEVDCSDAHRFNLDHPFVFLGVVLGPRLSNVEASLPNSTLDIGRNGILKLNLSPSEIASACRVCRTSQNTTRYRA